MEEHKDDRFSKWKIKESSMDVSALNNLVVSMRPAFKKAKVFAIKGITRQMEKYKSRKGSDKQIAVYQRKIKIMHQEIKSIKTLRPDDAIKFACANELPFDKLASLGDMAKRAMGRIATQPCLQQQVTKWRSKHEDWRALAAFMLSKNTGRRFKKKKEATSEVTTPEVTKTKSKENAKERKKPEKRLTGDNDDRKQPITSDVNSPSRVNSEKISHVKELGIQQQSDSGSDNNEDDTISNEDAADSNIDAADSNEDDYDSNGEQENTNSDSEDDTNSDNEGNSEEESRVKKVLNSEVENKELTQNKTVSSASKEMVVRKLNIDDLSGDGDLIITKAPSDKSVEFLFESNSPEKKRKRKDAFFMDSDNESNSDEDVSGEEEGGERLESDEEDEGFFSNSTDLPRKRFSDSSFVTLSAKDTSVRQSRGFEERRNTVERIPQHDWKKQSKPLERHDWRKQSKPFERPVDTKKESNKNNVQKREQKEYGTKTESRKIKPSNTAEKLHPSWEASKKRKLETSRIVAFQGKKITFDDD